MHKGGDQRIAQSEAVSRSLHLWRHERIAVARPPDLDLLRAAWRCLRESVRMAHETMTMCTYVRVTGILYTRGSCF